jgi:hypothetical protein
VQDLYNGGIERFNAHDLPGFMRQFAADIDMYTPTGWLRGRAAVEQRFADTFKRFSQVHMVTSDLRSHAVAPSTVLVEFKWEVFPMGGGAGSSAPKFAGVGSGVYVCRDSQWFEVLEHETVTFTDPRLQAPPAGAKP